MERSLMRGGKTLLTILFCATMFFAQASPSRAEDIGDPASSRKLPTEGATSEQKYPNEVFIDADNISFSEKTGLATAEGKVKIRNKDLRLFAPYVEYNAETNVADAYSDQRESIVIISGNNKYTGKHLKYNMKTRRGILTQASGKSEAMYMHGGTVRIMSMEDAVSQGIVRAPKKKKNRAEDVAEWLDVTATTCDFDAPHYRFVSKKVIIYPGKKTVLKTPKFYIGKKLILTYPFDYIVGKKSEKLSPIIRYDSDKGAGVGLKGPIDIGRMGELDIAGMYWTQDFWEARIHYKYEITDGLTLFGNTSRLYNSAKDETLWRPTWGLEYDKNGWEAKVRWAEREIISTDNESGATDDYDVWSKPEIYLRTPWFNESLFGGRLRVFGIWGKYRDSSRYSDGELTERFAYGAAYQGRPKWTLGALKPFYGARYAVYEYTEKDKTQKVTDAWFGFRYNIGDVRLSSTYRRRWVDGRSPMVWDRYYDNEYFFQTISFPLPFGESWEKWSLAVSGQYDLRRDDIRSMRYTLTYDKHCTTWQLWYHDKRSDDEKKLGLTFYINAYPEYKIDLGSDSGSNKKGDF